MTCMVNSPSYYCENGITSTSITNVPIKPGRTYTYWIDPVYSTARNYCNGNTTFNVTASVNSKIDILSYILKTDQNNGLTENVGNIFHQIVNGNNIYLQKFHNPDYTIHYTYDDNYIYLKTDSSDPANTNPAVNSSYSFNPGIWAKRFMEVGERIEMNNNQIKQMNSSCAITSYTFPYVNKLEALLLNQNLGGDLGIRDVIVISYAWGEGAVEKEYYAKGLGLVKWEHWLNGQLQISTGWVNKFTNTLPKPPRPYCFDLNGNLKTPGRSNNRTIIIRAFGTSGAGVYSIMELRLGTQLLKNWIVDGQAKDYIFQGNLDLSKEKLKVHFINDYNNLFEDRNLYVDYINVDGIKYPTIHPSIYSSGIWRLSDGCSPGYKQSNILACNGYFEFPTK